MQIAGCGWQCCLSFYTFNLTLKLISWNLWNMYRWCDVDCHVERHPHTLLILESAASDAVAVTKGMSWLASSSDPVASKIYMSSVKRHFNQVLKVIKLQTISWRYKDHSRVNDLNDIFCFLNGSKIPMVNIN